MRPAAATSSPARRDASSPASRWAGRATRRTSADAAPVSAARPAHDIARPAPVAGSSRGARRPGPGQGPDVRYHVPDVLGAQGELGHLLRLADAYSSAADELEQIAVVEPAHVARVGQVPRLRIEVGGARPVSLAGLAMTWRARRHEQHLSSGDRVAAPDRARQALRRDRRRNDPVDLALVALIDEPHEGEDLPDLVVGQGLADRVRHRLVRDLTSNQLEQRRVVAPELPFVVENRLAHSAAAPLAV